ncbi:MAG: AAA family ATPase [bacterium]
MFFIKKFLIFIFLIFIELICFPSIKKEISGFLSGGLIGLTSRIIISVNKKNGNIAEDNVVNDYKSFNTKGIKSKSEKDKITFDEIIGIDDAKEEVKMVVDFLQNPEKYKRLGAKIPKGILLEGPPGNGKTLLARAIANETNSSFFYESGSAFVEMYVGVGAKRLREIFDKARKNKPALIFIDEVDAIGASQRGIGGNEEYRQTLNEFLCQMDGFNKDESVIVIGATNNAFALDKALTRPGRFTKIINIPTPDQKARGDILKFYINKLPRVEIEYSYIEQLAQKTNFFSAAELENLVNEAALHAVNKNLDKVFQENLDFALQKTLKRH